MKSLAQHIDEFEKLMTSKGFDGYFLCNTGTRGALRESLHEHLTDVLQSQTSTRPFHLTTYSFWKEDKYIRCDFKMIYDGDNGFKIDKLEAGYFANQQINPVRSIELHPKTNEGIPTRIKMNSIVGPRKKRSLKF